MNKRTNYRKHFEATGEVVILRYHNRKLYNTLESAYISLDELLELRKQHGAKLNVLESRTLRNLTDSQLLSAFVQRADGNPELQANLVSVVEKLFITNAA